MSTATALKRVKLQIVTIDFCSFVAYEILKPIVVTKEQKSIVTICNLTLLSAVAVDMTEGLTALSHCYFGPERSLFAAPEGKEKDKHKKEAR